ncbi:MAG: hypothetical protein PWQ79_808 [Thermococcaceae archaeon]|nr:hypothetical protein [Thermococcaceae archaeon]MDK2913893.1 hypothetical protein [Thermococcaceae archaeon]
MDVREILNLLDEKGEVSLGTWKPISVKKNPDGTVDVLYRNLKVGSEEDPVFLWVYANVVEDEDEVDVRVLERITFQKKDFTWLSRYVLPKEKVYKGVVE